MLSERNASTSLSSLAASWFGDDAVLAGGDVGDTLSPALVADDSLRPFMESLTLAAILLLLILSCVIGNVFVIVAIAWDRDLRGRPQYYLIFSLAVADLIVSSYFPTLSPFPADFCSLFERAI